MGKVTDMTGKPITQEVRVNANDLKTVQCHCGNMYFISVNLFKLLPALYSRTGSQELIAIPYMQCTSCQAVYSLELMKNQEGGVV